jgi:D-alanyl-lipoteichoic acid acyltransferase DltB (MBOAT superfamily)
MHFLIFLIGLTVLNFLLGKIIYSYRERPVGKYLTIGSVGLNIAILLYYKYTNFMLGAISTIMHKPFIPYHIILPLGISFFIFQKIAFLIDCHKGDVQKITLVEFSLFVFFFPQLIAGPITHHNAVSPQLEKLAAQTEIIWRNVALGLSLLIIGLFKKVILADTLSVYADHLFDGSISEITGLLAWQGVLSYTLQIYFDFSGYSDMARGLAKLFNIDYPINFNSPYKAVSIIDFGDVGIFLYLNF